MASSKCTICGKGTRMRCPRCKAAYYCSADCQGKDFPLHSLLCKNYQAFLQTRPEIIESGHPEGEDSENSRDIPHKYVAALLFPKDAKYPELIWLKCFIDHDEGWLYMVCTGAIMEYADHPKPIYHIQNGQEIQTWMTDEFTGKPFNACVKNLTAGYGTAKDREGRGHHPFDWFDNIIVLNSTPTLTPLRESEFDDIGETNEFHDVTLSDLRYAFDFFTKHDRIFESDKENPYYIRNPREWFKAVKMYCNGDVKYDGKKKYQQVDVKFGREICFGHHGISSITKELGFPLRVLAVPVDDDRWRTKFHAFAIPRDDNWRVKWHEGKIPDEVPRCDPFQHMEVFNLMVEVDMHHEAYATADAKWYLLTGSTALSVMRNNYKDLMANQLEAVVSYSAECLRSKLIALNPGESDWIYDSAEEEDDDYDWDNPMPRKMRLKRVAFKNEYLSGRAFDRFFNKLKAAKMEEERKAGGGETWKFTFSPQPRPITDPETVIKDEEVAFKIEETDINMEDVEEATKNTMKDEDFYERERSPKRPRLK